MDQALILATWLSALIGLPVLAVIVIVSIRRERKAKQQGVETPPPSRMEAIAGWGLMSVILAPPVITAGWFVGWVDSLVMLIAVGLIVSAGLAAKMPGRRSQMLVSGVVAIVGILMYIVVMASWFVDATASLSAGMYIATIGLATGMAITVFYFAASSAEQ